MANTLTGDADLFLPEFDDPPAEPGPLLAEWLERAERRWSLSRLTLPHMMVRIVVAEQIYRAWSLLQGHPYHRA